MGKGQIYDLWIKIKDQDFKKNPLAILSLLLGILIPIWLPFLYLQHLSYFFAINTFDNWLNLTRYYSQMFGVRTLTLLFNSISIKYLLR